jgi:hypothetical protein
MTNSESAGSTNTPMLIAFATRKINVSFLCRLSSQGKSKKPEATQEFQLYNSSPVAGDPISMDLGPRSLVHLLEAGT